MKLVGDYVFQSPPEVVWASLLDPEVLAAVMPGCDKLELIGEGEYEGILNIKIGPVQGKFDGKVKLEDIREGEGYTMQVNGRGAPGFVKATVQVDLNAEGDGTRMAYDGDAQVGGRIASVGQRLLDTSAKAIVKQSLDGLDGIMSARSSGGGEQDGEPPPLPAGPTQSDFAAAVAKDVVRDLGPPVARWAVLAVVVAIVLYLLLG